LNSLDLNIDSEKVIKEYGTSFYFASRVLSKNTAIKIFKLYQFCRYVDDCADELTDLESTDKLNNLKEIINDLEVSYTSMKASPKSLSREPTDLTSFELEQHLKLKTLVSEILDAGVLKNDLLTLIKGALYEAEGNSVDSDDSLMHYCYLVAGVVGKMMCPLLGVKNKKAQSYSIDLGLGMQLTNICRDVLEDFKNKRSYLWSLKPVGESLDTDSNLKIVHSYIKTADLYYNRAFKGFCFIPLRSRLCILFASEIYKAIGHKIKRNSNEVFYSRCYLTTFEKVFVCFKSLIKIAKPSFWVFKDKRNKLLKNASKISI
jgi:phytoene synthase